MQTFIPYTSTKLTAQILDYRRLGKQRVEAIQIARCLLGLNGDTAGWRNHPATRMWRGYEGYLIEIYLKDIMDEWIRRGYRNDKCEKHYNYLRKMVDNFKEPYWFYDTRIMQSHRLMLSKKNPDYYLPIFDDISWSDIQNDDVSYVWPV